MSELRGVPDMLAVLREKKRPLARGKNVHNRQDTYLFCKYISKHGLGKTLQWLNIDIGKGNSPSKSLEMSESTSSSPSAIFEGCSLFRLFLRLSIEQGRTRARAPDAFGAEDAHAAGWKPKQCNAMQSKAKQSARSRGYACPGTRFCKRQRKRPTTKTRCLKSVYFSCRI